MEVIIDVFLILIEIIDKHLRRVCADEATHKMSWVETLYRCGYDELVVPVTGDDTVIERGVGLRRRLVEIIDINRRYILFSHVLNADVRASEIGCYRRMDEVMLSA